MGRQGWIGPVASQIILDYQGFSAWMSQWLLSPAVTLARSVSAPLVSMLPTEEPVWGSLVGQDFTPDAFAMCWCFPTEGAQAMHERWKPVLAVRCCGITLGTAHTEWQGSKSAAPGSTPSRGPVFLLLFTQKWHQRSASLLSIPPCGASSGWKLWEGRVLVIS